MTKPYPDFRSDNSGLTADEIRFIQTALIQAGFSVGSTGADGKLGPATNAAISAFKRSVGYAARPYVGPLTWDLLVELSEGRKPETEYTREQLPWIKEGMRVIGMHEREDNAPLRAWLKSDGRTLGDPAVHPWCAEFTETAIKLGLPYEPFPGALGQNPYWALNWRLLGKPTRPAYGAVASISRDGGGHVGFLVGEDATRYYLLGGNQNNRVSIAPFDKTRFVPESFRWPLTYDVPTDFTLPRLSASTLSNPSMV